MQFSFNRFYYQFIRQWKENKKAYTLALISLPILMGAAYLISVYSSNLSENNQKFIFGCGMIIFGGLFCSTLLSEYSPKSKGVRSLILPISAIEKLLVAIVYGLIIYPILYILLVYPILLLANYIDYEILGNLYLLATMNLKDFLGLLTIELTLLSIVLLCSLFYRKFIFIKAALTFLSLIFILTLSNNLINKALIGNSQPIKLSKELLNHLKITPKDAAKINFELTRSDPFSGLEFNTFNADLYRSVYISPSKPFDSIPVEVIVFILIGPVMLIACFYRLKEIEL